MVVGLLVAAIFGFLSTVLMVLFEIPFWKALGFDELVEWQLNWALVSRLSGRNTQGSMKWKVPLTIAGHLFHGAISSIVLFLLLPIVIVPFGLGSSILLATITYSIVLWVIFSIVLRGQYEVRLGFRSSDRGLLVALLSHVIYGSVLGILLFMT